MILIESEVMRMICSGHLLFGTT